MIYRFEDFSLDTELRELRSGGEMRALEPQVMALLELLIANRERMVSKDEIVEAIWDGRIVSEGSINSRIKLLRKALGDDGKQQRLIKTVHGQGFRFVGTVEDRSEPKQPTTPVEPKETMIGAAGMVVSGEPVVAVLPFDNMSSDPEQDFLADGMCEDIITILSKITGLKVIARNSSFAYKGKAVNLRDVGEALGASHVLEGSVRRSGDRLRVTGQLIDAPTSTHLWAERYDRQIDDIFEIQDDMTRQIVSALQVTLIEGDVAAYWTGATRSYQAWWHQTQAAPLIVRTHSLDHITRGRAHAEAAIAIDPDFAEAWATKALSEFFEMAGFWASDPAAKVASAVEAYGRAFALNPDNPFILSGQGLCEIHERRHDEGLALVERAANLAPTNVQIRVQLLHARLYAGVFDRTAAPDYAVPDRIAENLPKLAAAIHLVRGEYEKAVERAEANIERLPEEIHGHALAMAALAALGRHDEAREMLRIVLRHNPDFRIGHYRIRFPLKDAAISDSIEENLRAIGAPE